MLSFLFNNKGRKNDVDSLHDIPDLLQDMLHKKDAKKIAAIRKIYYLSDVGHKQNRIPMVLGNTTATTYTVDNYYNVLIPLANCLLHESGDAFHLACLALNNLSVPLENKQVMTLGPDSHTIIRALCYGVSRSDNPDAYICCICLHNLTHLQASNTKILHHPMISMQQSAAAYSSSSPSDDAYAYSSDSKLLSTTIVEASTNAYYPTFLHVLEKILLDHSQAVPNNIVPKPGSFAKLSALISWACGLLKNLSRSEQHVALIETTRIPECVINIIKASCSSQTILPSSWTELSSEDCSLSIILNLAQYSGFSKNTFLRADIVKAMESIKLVNANDEDFQSLKATMVCTFLNHSMVSNWSTMTTSTTNSTATTIPFNSTMVSELIHTSHEEMKRSNKLYVRFGKMLSASDVYHHLFPNIIAPQTPTDGTDLLGKYC